MRRLNHAEDATGAAITPRWATRRERAAVVGFWLVGTVVVHQVFVWLWSLAPNPFFTPQWWFFWCDAWIFVGSIVATYAMARGWNEFWLAWIGVDLVGVPFAFATGYVPTAVLYTSTGSSSSTASPSGSRRRRTEHRDVEPELVAAARDLTDGRRLTTDARDAAWMRRALQLAASGPWPDPNPRVGCVLVDADGELSSGRVATTAPARRTPRSTALGVAGDAGPRCDGLRLARAVLPHRAHRSLR